MPYPQRGVGNSYETTLHQVRSYGACIVRQTSSFLIVAGMICVYRDLGVGSEGQMGDWKQDYKTSHV